MKGVQLDNVRQIKLPVLWVDHENDACPQTPTKEARRIAKALNQPMEREASRAIVQWVTTQAAPSTVGK